MTIVAWSNDERSCVSDTVVDRIDLDAASQILESTTLIDGVYTACLRTAILSELCQPNDSSWKQRSIRAQNTAEARLHSTLRVAP